MWKQINIPIEWILINKWIQSQIYKHTTNTLIVLPDIIMGYSAILMHPFIFPKP